MPPSRDMKLHPAPSERSPVTVRLRQHVGARRTATMADATSCPPRRCAAWASLMRTPRKRADSYLRQCCDAAALLAAAVWSAPLVHAAACATLAANWRLLRGKMHGGKQQLRIGCGQSSRDSKGPFLRSPFWRGLFFPLVNGTQPKDLAVRHGEPRGSAWCVRRPRRQLQPGKRPPADSHGTGMPRISAKIVDVAPSVPKIFASGGVEQRVRPVGKTVPRPYAVEIKRLIRAGTQRHTQNSASCGGS